MTKPDGGDGPGAARLELRAALERQAAIRDVLRTITGSAFDLRPVLRKIIEKATELCGAKVGFIYLREGDLFRIVESWAPASVEPEWTQLREFISRNPVRLDDTGVVARVHRAAAPVVIPDTAVDPDYPKQALSFFPDPHITLLGVPLMKDGAVIGVLSIGAQPARPFEDREIDLVLTFADQTVIALETARLLSDTKEALDRQTATNEILKVISGSPFDLQPVLQTVIESAARLCQAENGFLYIREGDLFHERAGVGPAYTPELHKLHEANPLRVGDRGRVVGRVSGEGRTVHIPDVLQDPDYTYWEAQRLGRFRSILGVPLLREGRVLGVISLWRTEPRPFEPKQIDIVSSFADQAVIAIENARLYGIVQRQREELRRFLSPQVADLITSAEGEALLKGHRREITVVFCDLRGFTAFSEIAEPEEALAVVRTYHETLGPLIVEHGGTLEHFEGDGAMVFFNDPVPVDAPVLQAVRMTLAMRDRMVEISARWRKRGYDLGFGCGIATGYATLGRIGFEGRYDYGAIGPVTNLASRLSSEAKAGQILLSQRSFAALEDLIEADALGEIEVKGYGRPQPAYNVLKLKTPARRDA